MEPKTKILPRRRSANSINKARINKARAYANESPTLGNLFNAFINWFNGTKLLGGASDYITGNAPVGGRKLQLLSPQLIKTLMPRDRAVYTNALNKITEQDAMRQLIKNQANDPRYQEAKDASGEYWNDWQRGAFDDPIYEEFDSGFDPELEWLEYKYGGTDSYPYLYNEIARRRGLPLMNATGLNY